MSCNFSEKKLYQHNTSFECDADDLQSHLVGTKTYKEIKHT